MAKEPRIKHANNNEGPTPEGGLEAAPVNPDAETPSDETTPAGPDEIPPMGEPEKTPEPETLPPGPPENMPGRGDPTPSFKPPTQAARVYDIAAMATDLSNLTGHKY